jgi:hypothetical protein
MRARHLALVCLLTSSASAGPDKPKPIDAKAIAAKLDVFRDEVGNVYVLPRPDSFSFSDAHDWLFYGDGKTMYQQRIVGGGGEEGKRFEWAVWSPRAKGMPQASLAPIDGVMTLECRHTKDGVRPLKQLNADEARTLFQKATFLPPLWKRQTYLLARDDDGVYYFVDELREEFGGNGYRVFVGPKGAMKELPMTNVVADSAGAIFATKTGQLKLVNNDKKLDEGKDKPDEHTAYWIKGGKKVELIRLDPWDNRYLIYRELGIYGQLGVVCDDL